MIDLNEHKVLIEYPCRWNYKVVGEDKFELKREIAKEILKHDFEITSSKASKNGKFVSLNVDVEVTSDKQREEIYANLSNLKCVLQII